MEFSSELDRAIARTLCWFAVFEYPLTVFELWKWLWSPGRAYAFAQVSEALETSRWLQEKIERQDGFVALKGPSGIAEQIRLRRERFVDAARKFGKLKRVARWFAALPFVRAVAAVNTLAWSHTRPNSDIDLFIVSRPGAAWSARFWSVLPFALTGSRPGERSVDPFCFSFFASADALNLTALQIPEEDPYLAYWIASIVPVFDKDGLLPRLMEENPWVRKTLPHVWGRDLHAVHRPSFVPEIVFAPSGRWFESLVRRFQHKKFPTKIRAMANLDTRVVLNDQWLKFHDNDRREEYRKKWLELQAEYVA